MLSILDFFGEVKQEKLSVGEKVTVKRKPICYNANNIRKNYKKGDDIMMTMNTAQFEQYTQAQAQPVLVEFSVY